MRGFISNLGTYAIDSNLIFENKQRMFEKI